MERERDRRAHERRHRDFIGFVKTPTVCLCRALTASPSGNSLKFSRASPSLPVQIVVVCQANVQKRALSPDQFVTHGERRWTAERRGSWRRRWATSEQNVWRNARVTPRAESLRDGLGRGCDREGTTPFCVRSCIATERDNDHAPRQGSPPVLRHRWGRRRRSFGSARYWRHRSEGKRPEDIRDALWGSGIPLSYPLLVLPPLFPTRNCTAARSDRSSPPRVARADARTWG